MTKLTIVLLLIAIAATPIFASRFLPWWGALIVLVAEITVLLAFAPRLISAIVQKRLVAIFRQRSLALKDAAVEVHEVRQIEAGDCQPDASLEPADGEKVSRHVQVDLTLTPTGTQEYRPSEIGLVGAGASDEEDANEPGAFALRVRLISQEGEHECDQVSGPVRLRIVFGIPDDLGPEVRFRYFFEQFGEFRLP